jgi:SPP1 family predicted phage head-tail adaptor
MVAAASFNSRITIQTKTISRSPMGDETEVWTDLATVWAVRRDMRGAEYYNAQALREQGDVMFTIRYLTGFDAEARVICDGQRYEITRTPVRIGGRTRYLEIYCSSGIRDAL